jgi:hypothetical protein
MTASARVQGRDRVGGGVRDPGEIIRGIDWLKLAVDVRLLQLVDKVPAANLASHAVLCPQLHAQLSSIGLRSYTIGTLASSPAFQPARRAAR